MQVYPAWLVNLLLEQLAMSSLFPIFDPLYVARSFASAILGVVLLQSGVDKVVDRAGNLDWLNGHFSKTFLAAHVNLLVTLLTGLELAAGASSLLGACIVVLGGSAQLAYMGAVLSATSFVALMTGQRIAKDYAGAGVLVPYCVFTVMALILLSEGTITFVPR